MASISKRLSSRQILIVAAIAVLAITAWVIYSNAIPTPTRPLQGTTFRIVKEDSNDPSNEVRKVLGEQLRLFGGDVENLGTNNATLEVKWSWSDPEQTIAARLWIQFSTDRFDTLPISAAVSRETVKQGPNEEATRHALAEEAARLIANSLANLARREYGWAAQSGQ